MTARTLLKQFKECAELLYGKTFLLKLKVAAYKSHVRPAILYGSDTGHMLN